MGNRSDFQIIQTIPAQQHAGKARNQGTTDNSHIGQHTHTQFGKY